MSRAHVIPFVRGGPFDLRTIRDLYRINLAYGYPPQRLGALVKAIRVSWAGWRYSLALQREA